MRDLKRTRGFTLVELLIVIIIIAVLAAVVVPKFANSSLRSREAALRSDLKVMRNAIDLFKSDTGSFPAQLSDLTLETAPANGKDSGGNNKAINASDFKGPYLEEIKKDPISGGSYTYSVTSPTVGKVKAPAGTAIDGTDYSTW
jgi:general secretion pathway protein G